MGVDAGEAHTPALLLSLFSCVGFWPEKYVATALDPAPVGHSVFSPVLFSAIIFCVVLYFEFSNGCLFLVDYFRYHLVYCDYISLCRCKSVLSDVLATRLLAWDGFI